MLLGSVNFLAPRHQKHVPWRRRGGHRGVDGKPQGTLTIRHVQMEMNRVCYKINLGPKWDEWKLDCEAYLPMGIPWACPRLVQSYSCTPNLLLPMWSPWAVTLFTLSSFSPDTHHAQSTAMCFECCLLNMPPKHSCLLTPLLGPHPCRLHY